MPEFDPLASPEPTYLQIANALQTRIQAGEFPVRLPAERALADHYGIAYQTLRHAIDVLRERGVVITRHGRGNFITPADKPR
jgi:GntR family transcriptional regulator